MVQLRSSLVLVGALALCACDRQVDRTYQGESLLRIEGNVVIPLGLEGGALVRQLDVFDPPPPEALKRVEPGGLEIAIGSSPHWRRTTPAAC
jgi:hypothetical protein